MDINLLFKVLTVFNVLSLFFSIYFIYKIGELNFKSIRIYLSIIAFVYIIGFIYIEAYFIKHSFTDESDTLTLIVVTISAQMLLLILYTVIRLLAYVSLPKEGGKEALFELNSNVSAYRGVISSKINLCIPFNVMKIKILNYRKLTDISSEKLFNKTMSYSVIALKKILKNKHLDFYFDTNEIIIIGYSTDREEIEQLANTVYELLTYPILIKNQNIILQPVIGCAISSADIDSSEEFLKRVDIACYKAKKLGLVIDFYRSTYSDLIHEEVFILSKLIKAISNDEFELYYQPIVNSIDKTVHGYEALIRWPQSDGSMIPPDKFIAIAETNNYIKGITHWVIKQVSYDIAAFKRENIHPQVHVNISTLDLHDNDLYNQLFELVSNKKLEPSDLILEVTESALMSDVDAAYLMLSKFSELGFYISIDDFGTGFSSLSLLRVLSFNQIKIDQSFIRNMAIGNSDYAIVASTVYLAHSLGCNVVAEGVEDFHLFDELKELGCDYIQGYCISKPKGFTEILHWSLREIEIKKLAAID
ncbi:GGDEF domain-containing phosphodiesterase [Aliivibrio sp. S3MY1]|uniref:GGDEF domain-containing phosphodiesterase n=1 Tax=unclassified Aliivibrio TaxID=2645654 RepID=UPI0023783D67|nr:MULTISPECIES: GGDEF domain-containing phosphodiesterase [unclassified Aliivibrio]MDD9194430.1 GGDEF domain-containing phosphodiesterase [Aliivibrio sp. S3MY1]MDD9198231.1 GGDEF domain-containing phosphodiesterase [Aliivibrio sp. S2MY1]